MGESVEEGEAHERELFGGQPRQRGAHRLLALLQVDLSQEMTNLLMANRMYGANLSVMQQARDSYQQALKIGTSS